MKRPREDSTSAPPSKRVAESSDLPRLTTNDALQYLKAVKEKFKDDSRKYAEFLEVMKDFKAQRVDTNGVIGRVKELFKGHDKLILGFNSFLPKGYQIVLDERPERPKQPVEFDQAISFVNKIKTRFQENEHVYKAFLEILNNYRRGHKTIGEVYEEVASLFHEHPDLLDEFTRFLPDNNNNISSAPARVLRLDDKPHRSNALEKSNKRERASERDGKAENRRRVEKDRRDDRREDFERDAERLPHKRKSARRADELIRKQSQNGEGPFAFFDRAKARLRGNREVYKELIKVVNLYNEQIIDRSDLQSLAAGLLEKYPDLVEAFNELLQSENAEGYLSVVMPKKTEPDAKREREKDQEKDKDMDGKQSLTQLKDKNLNKAISDLDLSSCERCTPSYRLLPNYYPRLISSHRNDLAKSVLNDCWVSVTSGSEDYSFKHMRRNQYEESLFRCEDDRFELDMLLESTKVTAKHMAELMERLRDNNQVRIDDHLSAINLRCIERIYGDHGLDIIELLRKNPASALPVVHARLTQKEEEWTKCRGEMNKVWAEVYAKNYHKSLDHRSFYFKQQDKRSLSTKGLLAEIKEIHEKKKKEEDYVLSMVMGNRRPYIPDLKFNCPDSSIHQDLFQILKYSADELCTMEQSDKVMRMWTTFMECMFGLPYGTEDPEGTANKQAPGIKALSSSSESAAGGTCAKVAQDECTTASSLPELASRDDLAGKGNAENSEAHGAEEHRKAFKMNAERDVAGSKASRERGPKKNSEGGKKSQSGSPTKVDREEGELSPSLDVDERRSLDHHTAGEAVVKSSGKRPLKQDDFDEADADHDVDDEAEESVQQKSSDDSENGSEAGEEVSGSEMGTADGSPEDHEDEGDDEKAESDYEGMADADEAHSSADRTSMFCKPLAPHSKYLDLPRASSKNSTIFYGSDLFYILFRLYQTLYERIHSAKVNAVTAEQKWKNGKDTAPPNLYQEFVRVLYNLLDGSADHSKFEDECRSIIGTQSYVLFTLDKLLYKLVKQLQAVAGDEIANKLLALQTYERSRGPGGFSDLIYHANACVVLQDENIYRFEHRPACTDFLVQLMDGGSEKIEVPPNAMEATFSSYLHDYLSGEPGPKAGRNVFLRRNENSEELEKAMKDVRVLNGLEHKISCKTSKASYVLDTEDLFHRRKYRRKECSVCKGSLEAEAAGCGHLCNSCSLQRQKGLCPSCFKDDKRRKHRVQRFRQWLNGRIEN